MFESQSYRTARAGIDQLAHSFLRGSVHESHEARLLLLSSLQSAMKALSARERSKLTGYRPVIVMGFPPETRRNYDSWITEALDTR